MEADLIIDAGMHKGEDTEFYLKKGFRVIAIEANRTLCELVAKRHSEQIASGLLHIVNAAIVEDPGPTPFYINEQVTDWGTAQKSWVSRNQMMGTSAREVTVQGIRFEEVLERHGVPYFLKIDIEGNDTLCLEGLKDYGQRPKFISIESNKTDWGALTDEFDLLRELGFDRFKVVNQFPTAEQVCPNPAREGEFADHTFEFGSSGLFGDEAPGQWRTRAQALLHYRWIFAKYRAVGNNGVIPNFHRRFKPGTRFKKLSHPGWYDTHARRS